MTQNDDCGQKQLREVPFGIFKAKGSMHICAFYDICLSKRKNGDWTSVCFHKGFCRHIIPGLQSFENMPASFFIEGQDLLKTQGDIFLKRLIWSCVAKIRSSGIIHSGEWCPCPSECLEQVKPSLINSKGPRLAREFSQNRLFWDLLSLRFKWCFSTTSSDIISHILK